MLEGLNRRAGFEPDHGAGEGHAQYRRPRSLVRDLYGADRFDMLTDPVLSGVAIHALTMRDPFR